MLDIFISYSRENLLDVKTLKQDFESLGHSVWFDQNLTGGKVWWDNILSQICECTLFVYALSPSSLDSTACIKEYQYAFDLNKRILPILVSDISLNLLPSNLSVIQYIDYRLKDRQAVLSLVKAIQDLPEPIDIPDPLPALPDVPISYLGNLKNEIESNTLTIGEQMTLVIKLKEHILNAKEHEDALTLLYRLRNRDDLFAKVAEEIDKIFTQAKATTSKRDKPKLNKSRPTTISSAKPSNSKAKPNSSVQRRQFLFQRVKEIIVDKLGADASEVKKNASLANDLGADTLDKIELVMLLEQEYNINISNSDEESFHSVGDIVDYLFQKGI